MNASLTTDEQCSHDFQPIDSSGQRACIHCNARAPYVFVDTAALLQLGKRMEADFHLRRAYSLEQIQQITNAAHEIDGLRNLLRCAYEDVPGWVGDASLMLRRVKR